MEFLFGRARLSFRRFIRSLLFAVDDEGRRRAKYERRRNRLGAVLGVGLAGVVIWSGFAWQSRRDDSSASTEHAWNTHDLDEIDREIDASRGETPSTITVPGVSRKLEPQKPAAAFDDQIVQTQSTADNEGPSLLLTHSAPSIGSETAPVLTPPAPSRAPVGAQLLGIIEDIPEHHEQPRTRNVRAPRPAAGPAIVPGSTEP